MLKGWASSRGNIDSGLTQGSILALLLFLIFINHFSNDLSLNVKRFADDASLFSVIHAWMGQNRIHFLTSDQTGTNLTWEITRQWLTDKFSMWIWPDKGNVPCYEKLNDKKFRPKYYNLVRQIWRRLNTDKQIKKTCIQCKRMGGRNWRNSTEYNDINTLFPKKYITTRKCVKHD